MSEVRESRIALTVLVPGLLRSYTAGAASVSLVAPHDASIDDVLRELDAKFPGMRFRIVDEQRQVRRHMKIFVDAELVRDLSSPVTGAREIMIVGALSGG